MSLKNDENQALETMDLVFILAIAGRIDAQTRVIAKQIDEKTRKIAKLIDQDRSIYYAYSILDSLSTACTMAKYVADMLNTNNDSDSMHDIMMSPGALIAFSIESVFLVSFSYLATYFDNDQNDVYKKFIVTAWPYLRDVMKGLKNAYKGWRSAVSALSLIAGIDIKYLIAPLGLFLGILGAANRFWLRYMTEDRKLKMSSNSKLLARIKTLNSLSAEEHLYLLSLIEYQSLASRTMAYVSMAFGGFIDGLYLYVGVLGLAALSPPMLIAMSIICIFYTLVCIITRLYEEYDYQRRLFVTQTQCQLMLLTKETETHYLDLLFLKEIDFPSFQELDEIKRKERELALLIKRFEEKKTALQALHNKTYLSALLMGLKNGLAAYGALASILFLIAAIIVLTGAAFPPFLLISSVILGLAFMIGFTIHALVENYKHINKENSENKSYQQLLDIKNKILLDQLKDTDPLPEQSIHSSLKSGLSLDPSPQYFFLEWFEVCRSLFSGIGKGQKFIDCALGFLQEKNDQGHYKDTPIMYVLGAISAFFFGIVLALRAFAKGFGRSPLGAADLAEGIEPIPNTKEQSPSVVIPTTKTTENVPPPEAPGESINYTKPPIDSPKISSVTSSFFNRTLSKQAINPPTINLNSTIELRI